MTFPIVEIYCPECNEPMTLVNKPSIENTVFNREEYDKIVDYHYQCKANERHVGKWHEWSMELSKDVLYKGKLKDDGEPEKININNAQNFSKASEWCSISSEKEIVVMRILIPSLSNSELVADQLKLDATWDGNYDKLTPSDCEYYNKDYCIPCKSLDNFYECETVKIGNQIKIDKWKPEEPSKELAELEAKVELTRKKYPNEKDYIYAFMDAGKKIITGKMISDTDTYEMLKETIELANPEKLKLPRELGFSMISNKMKVFMNACFDLILNEEV